MRLDLKVDGQSHHGGHAAASGPDRSPPQNLEAERSVLGSCILKNAAIDDVVAMGLGHDDFLRAAHEELWLAILEVQRAGDAVDAVTLAEYLIGIGRFDKLGGDEFLREVIEAVPHAENAAYYAAIVREKAVGRRVVEACTDILRQCYSNQFTASDLLCEAQERLLSLSDRDAGGETTSYAALMVETLTRMDLRSEHGLTGLTTGFPLLDDMTGGFRPGELWILAARPGVGKTSAALGFAKAVAGGNRRRPGAPVLFFSIEMGREPLGDRIITNESGVDNDRFQRPWALDDGERRRLVEAGMGLRGLPIEVDFSPSRSVAEVAAAARRMQRRRGLGLAIVDYLQLLDGTRRKSDNREQEVARISKDLKTLARTLCAPVVTLAQLNREVERRADKTPVLSDLRESGSLEQDADVVLLLHRPEYYNPADRPGTAELIVAKNRNGRTGIVPLSFEASCTRFSPMAREREAYTPPAPCDDSSY